MSIGTPKASWLTAIVLPGAPGSKHVSCAYASSAWNLADLACIVLFYWFYALSIDAAHWAGSRDAAIEYGQCSDVCLGAGFFDNYNAFTAVMDMRNILSTACLLVLLRSIKFINHYFKSTSLLVKVLAKGRDELLIFTFIFVLSVFAFAFCFWLRLGAQIDAFSSISMSMHVWILQYVSNTNRRASAMNASAQLQRK